MNFDERRYRPMGTADLFDEAFDLYKKNFLLFFGTAALVYVPLQVLLVVYDYAWLQSFDRSLLAAVGSADFLRILDLYGEWIVRDLATLPIYFVAITFMVGALASAISARYLNRPITILGSYRQALGRWLPLLVSFLIYNVLVAIGLVFCVFPAVFPLVIFAFVPQAAVVEGGGLFYPLARAKALAAGHGGNIFWCFLLLTALYFVLSWALQVPLSFLSSLLVDSSMPALPGLAANRQVADQIADFLAALIVIPFLLSVTTLLYYDLRIRKEGFDMEILAESLGYPPVDLPGVRPFGAPPPGAPVRISLPRGKRGSK